MEFYSKCFPILGFLQRSIKVREEQKARAKQRNSQLWEEEVGGRDLDLGH